MSDDALIRRANLRALGKTPTELSQDIGGGYSYWAAMLSVAGKKAFGEKVARKIEERYGLPRGCMDLPSGVTHKAAHDPTWPFDQVDRNRYYALSDSAKGFVQARIMDEIEIQERKQSRGNGSTG